MSEINLFFQLYNCWLLMLVTYEYNELQRTCTIHFKTEKVMAYIVFGHENGHAEYRHECIRSYSYAENMLR